MKEKERVILWTIIAAGLFCCELTAVTLTPFAKIGNGTRFGSSGMFFNLLCIGSSYMIPLVLFCMGMKFMKYVIAVVNALWLICHPVIALICFTGLYTVSSGPEDLAACAAAGLLSAGSFIVTILWYPLCRKKK